MNHRIACLCCILCVLCLTLCGCVSQETVPAAQLTLPPAQEKRAAPENDTRQSYSQTLLLYLPSLDGTQLLSVPQTVNLSASQHSAAALCETLLAHPGTDVTAPVGGDVTISLTDTDAVEVSGQTVTVILAASALRLSHEQLFTVGQALANTLCQNGDLQYVNVLISGTQPGLNIAATLPAGSFQGNTREDLSSLWARASAPLNSGRRSFAVTLYFPAPSGKGILCEARTLLFSSQDLPGMALTLLDALSAGAESLPKAPQCPDLRDMLLEAPTLSETGGARRLILRFSQDLNAALINAGITRSVMMASLCCTMTTFLPGIEGIEVQIGGERVTTLTPSGTYNRAGETITFADGIMHRRDFSGFLLSECTLYFADAEGNLVRVQRPVPFYEACSARALLEQLMLGPQPFDSQTGLSPVLPTGLRPADLLGVAYADGAMLLNFSSQLSSLAASLNKTAEQALIYGAVNTLCELPPVKKVVFFIQGAQPESLAGTLYLPGDFLPNLDLVR